MSTTRRSVLICNVKALQLSASKVSKLRKIDGHMGLNIKASSMPFASFNSSTPLQARIRVPSQLKLCRLISAVRSFVFPSGLPLAVKPSAYRNILVRSVCRDCLVLFKISACKVVGYSPVPVLLTLSCLHLCLKQVSGESLNSLPNKYKALSIMVSSSASCSQDTE